MEVAALTVVEECPAAEGTAEVVPPMCERAATAWVIAFLSQAPAAGAETLTSTVALAVARPARRGAAPQMVRAGAAEAVGRRVKVDREALPA